MEKNEYRKGRRSVEGMKMYEEREINRGRGVKQTNRHEKLRIG